MNLNIKLDIETILVLILLVIFIVSIIMLKIISVKKGQSLRTTFLGNDNIDYDIRDYDYSEDNSRSYIDDIMPDNIELTQEELAEINKGYEDYE